MASLRWQQLTDPDGFSPVATADGSPPPLLGRGSSFPTAPCIMHSFYVDLNMRRSPPDHETDSNKSNKTNARLECYRSILLIYHKCVEKSPLFLTPFRLPAEPVQKSELTEQNEKLRKKPLGCKKVMFVCLLSMGPLRSWCWLTRTA